MKKLLMTGLFAVLMLGAFAQGHRGGVVVRPRTTTVFVGGGFYSPYYSPFYSPFGYPYYSQPMVRPRPSELDQEIADIEHDYSQKISSARSSLSGKAKREEVRRLKDARDKEIADAKQDYYKQ